MTPTKAIKSECRFCMNSEILRECKSEDCKLNNKTLPALKRIKAHCISCVPEQNVQCVRKCTGELLDGKMCHLHLYREGHDPKRKGKGNINIGRYGIETRFKKDTVVKR